MLNTLVWIMAIRLVLSAKYFSSGSVGKDTLDIVVLRVQFILISQVRFDVMLVCRLNHYLLVC